MVKVKDSPAFQMYAADLYVDTNEWTCEEVGAYTKLLMSEWANGDIPCAEDRLSRITGQSLRGFRRVAPQVLTKFVPTGTGRMINLRLEETRLNQRNFRKRQQEKANEGAKQRAAAAELLAEPMAEPSVEPSALPAASPSSSSSSSNIISKDIIEKDILTPEQPPAAVPPIPQEGGKKPKAEIVYDEETKLAFKAVIDYLNKKTNKNFSWRNVSTQHHINARIREGRKFEDFQYVINNKVDQWGDDSQMFMYIRPDTLFGSKFEAYLNEAPVMKREKNPFVRG